MKVRPYQYRGINDIFKAWEVSDVVMYSLGTGGGKTVIAVEIITHFILRKLKAQFVAHREQLILQFDKTMKRNQILPGIIKAKIPPHYDRPVQVCSIQTAIRRLDQIPHADIYVVDEAHHVTDKNGYSELLNINPNAKILLITATPYRLSGEGFTDVIKGKKTVLVQGPQVGELIEDGWLVPIRYFIASIPDMSNAGLSKGEYKDEDSQKAMELAPIVQSYKDNANGLQGICFAINKAHAYSIASDYWRNNIPVEVITDDTPDEDVIENERVKIKGRKSIIASFEAGIIKIIINVGIYTEGADFPNVEFVQLCCPTMSLSKVLQMVGRGTRAIAGIVDNYDTTQARKDAIAASAKPYCIVLDNAGCYLKHRFPQDRRNWEMFFNGWKKEKKAESTTETMQIEIFVVKDAAGNVFTTKNIKETIGLELIEVTTEIKTKVINFTAIKEFDRTYAVYKNSKKIKTPGKVALNKFIDYCAQHNILMTPDVWNYLRRKLYLEIEERRHRTIKNREVQPDNYPEEFFNKIMTNMDNEGCTDEYMRSKERKYTQENREQILEYLSKK